MNIHLPRLYAELVADLILKSDRSTMEDYHDWEHLDNFTEAVENMIRLEKSIARCGLRQFGMMAVTPGMIESLMLLRKSRYHWPISWNRISGVANESFTRRFRI